MTVRLCRTYCWPLLAALSFLCLSSVAIAQSTVTLAWDPNQETDLAGYNVYYGTASGYYTTKIDVGNVTTNRVTGLLCGNTYYFVVTAYNTSGLESDPSNEVNWRPQPPTNAPMAFAVISAPSPNGLSRALLTWTSNYLARGYVLFWGPATNLMTNRISLSLTNQYWPNLAPGLYWFALAGTNSCGEGPRTAPLRVAIPAPPRIRVQSILQAAASPLGPWSPLTTNDFWAYAETPNTFFRTWIGTTLEP